ncbi:hypothetical protein LG290_12405 [Halomonas sediminis]
MNSLIDTFQSYVWSLAIALIILLGLHLAAYIHGYQFLVYRCYGAIIASLLVGASAFWWLPLLVDSQLAYVDSFFGWVVLATCAFWVAVIAYLYLHPLSFLLRETRD